MKEQSKRKRTLLALGAFIVLLIPIGAIAWLNQFYQANDGKIDEAFFNTQSLIFIAILPLSLVLYFHLVSLIYREKAIKWLLIPILGFIGLAVLCLPIGFFGYMGGKWWWFFDTDWELLMETGRTTESGAFGQKLIKGGMCVAFLGVFLLPLVARQNPDADDGGGIV